jgi:Flp pilus assembly protein TadD
LATIEQEQGRLDEAVTSFRESVRLSPSHAEPRIGLAVALRQQGDAAAADRELKAVLEMSREDPRVLLVLGQTYQQLGQLERAIECFDLAVQRQPHDPRLRKSLGIALQTGGRADEAVEHYRTVLRQQPRAADVANNLAWILATHPRDDVRDPAEAVRLANLVNRVTGGDNPTVLDTLAVALAAQGQFESAVRTAERALELGRAQNNATLCDNISTRLELYRRSQPYRENANQP